MATQVLDSQLVTVDGLQLTAQGIGMVRRATLATLCVGIGLGVLVALPLVAAAGLVLAFIGGPRLAGQVFVSTLLLAVALLTRPRAS